MLIMVFECLIVVGGAILVAPVRILKAIGLCIMPVVGEALLDLPRNPSRGRPLCLWVIELDN